VVTRVTPGPSVEILGGGGGGGGRDTGRADAFAGSGGGGSGFGVPALLPGGREGDGQIIITASFR
jgi:hypothetical protein